MDEFLQRMGELFECVLFTASLAKVSRADPGSEADPGTQLGHRPNPGMNLTSES